MRSPIAAIWTDPDYQRLPGITDPVQLEVQVQDYRNGNISLQTPLIEAHLRLIMAILRKHRHRRNYADIEGSALLALTEAVVNARTTLQDNNITPYIVASVQFRIRDALANDRVIAVKARTFRHKVAKGEITQDGNNPHASILACVARVEESHSDCYSRHHEGFYGVPVASRTEPTLEFKEALELAIVTEQERQVIDLRAQGYVYRDFEAVMGLKTGRISQIVRRVEERFDLLYVS